MLIFTIKYPSDWKSTVTKGSGGSNYVVFYSALDFSSGRNISTVLVGVADANATTLDELISQYKSSERKILGESKTTLSGLPDIFCFCYHAYVYSILADR